MMKPITSLLISVFALFVVSCSNHTASGTASGTDTLKTDTPSWALHPFIKIDSVNPVLSPGTGSFTDPVTEKKVLWEEKDVFNPAIVNREGKVWMLYRAQDKVGKPAGTSRIGLAVSTDAMHFNRIPKPVLYPDNDACKKYEWEGGCEDPRVVRDDKGTYYMTYTAFDGKTARLFVAASADLQHWKKYGNAFAKAYNGKYANGWSKSGSIVSTYQNGEPVATKINGKYWMYWGDKQIWAATSDDLINWTPVQDSAGNLQVALPTRPGMFDSDLVESGPPAMVTGKGILLIYNSRNVPAIGDKSLPEGTYAASEALFDKNAPSKLISRMNTWIMKPEKPYEISGQVNQVCFLEGLTEFNHKWYVYYGTADSKIAVAVCPAH